MLCNLISVAQQSGNHQSGCTVENSVCSAFPVKGKIQRLWQNMSNKCYHITKIDLTSWKCTLNRNLISSEIFQIEAWQDWNQDVLQNRWSESLLRTAGSMSASLLDWRSWVCASEKAANPCHLHKLPVETEPGRRQNKTIPLLWQCLDKLSMSIRTEEF